MRAAHSTHLEALAEFYLPLCASVSGFAKEQVKDIDEVYESKASEAATRAGAAAYREGAMKALAEELAQQTLLQSALRGIFGIHRRPVLPEFGAAEGAGGAADAGVGPGVGPGALAGPAHEEDKVPIFLRSTLRAAWSVAWGTGCLQSLSIKSSSMRDILRLVCQDYESGKCMSECRPPLLLTLYPRTSHLFKPSPLLPCATPLYCAVYCPKTAQAWRSGQAIFMPPPRPTTPVTLALTCACAPRLCCPRA